MRSAPFRLKIWKDQEPGARMLAEFIRSKLEGRSRVDLEIRGDCST